MKTVNAILQKNSMQHLCISGNAWVIDALSLMKSENKDFVIVMESDNYIGIMSEKDCSHKIILEGINSRRTTVKEIMANNLPFVDIEDSIHDCMRLMDTFKTHYLPVAEEFLFTGVITLDDLLRASVEEDAEKMREQKIQSTEDYHFYPVKSLPEIHRLGKFR